MAWWKNQEARIAALEEEVRKLRADLTWSTRMYVRPNTSDILFYSMSAYRNNSVEIGYVLSKVLDHLGLELKRKDAVPESIKLEPKQ